MWSGRAGQIADAVVEDTTGRVTEAWTGPQVAWKMARGARRRIRRQDPAEAVRLDRLLPRSSSLGLADLRRPLSMRNVDLLALLGFSISLVFFDRGEIFRSVPLVYPVLVYLLVRGLWVGCGRRAGALQSVWPTWMLAVVAVFLLGFRVGLNLQAPRGVIDVGLAGVVGAEPHPRRRGAVREHAAERRSRAVRPGGRRRVRARPRADERSLRGGDRARRHVRARSRTRRTYPRPRSSDGAAGGTRSPPRTRRPSPSTCSRSSSSSWSASGSAGRGSPSCSRSRGRRTRSRRTR